MSVREPWRLRKALLAGAVALALTGAGTAIGWSATDVPSPSPSPTESAPGQPGQPGQSGNAGKPGKADKAQRPQHLHSESVVKKADGTFETRLSQQGTVDSASDSSVTVKSEDGFTQTYAVNAETKIIKFPPPAADGSTAKGGDGKRLRPAEVGIGEIARGESVRISGVKSGNDVTARQVVEGAPTGPGKGMGMGRGHGHGKGHGHGLGKLKDR